MSDAMNVKECLVRDSKKSRYLTNVMSPTERLRLNEDFFFFFHNDS